MMGSEILVNFQDSHFFPFILQQQFTIIDFVAYTGGAFGLFLGFSVLSFVEIFYYFSVRVFFDFKQMKKIQNENQNSEFKSKSKLNLFCFNFFENSSIHGMNQIVMEKRFSIERFLWFLLVASSLIYCSFVTKDLYVKYKNAPILLGYEDRSKIKDEVRKFAIY
jgi:hypothetical protein